MSSCVVRVAFGAFIGAAAAYAVLWAVGMRADARAVLGLMFLLLGIQLGALLYERRNGGDRVA